MRVEFPRLEQKSKEMLNMLTKDSKFVDSTWPSTVEESFVRQHADGGRWMLKEKAEADHGAGSVGREAVQHALDAGVY